MSTSLCVCVCLSVCLSASTSPEPHARSLPIFLCMLPMAVAPSSSAAWWRNPKGKRQLWGLSGSFKSIGYLRCSSRCRVRSKGITKSSCSRRDHSVCQASVKRNPENSERRRCGLSAEKGVMRVHSGGEVWYIRGPRPSCGLKVSNTTCDKKNRQKISAKVHWLRVRESAGLRCS